MAIGGPAFEAPAEALVELPIRCQVDRPARPFRFILEYTSDAGKIEELRPSRFVVTEGPNPAQRRSGRPIEWIYVHVRSEPALAVGVHHLVTMHVRFLPRRGAQSFGVKARPLDGESQVVLAVFDTGIQLGRDAVTREVRPFPVPDWMLVPIGAGS